MAYRPEVWIDFDSSPRVIWVGSPTTTITVQDIVDTVHTLEAEPTNMSFPKLIDTAGKSFLYNDGTNNYYTGIVLTLLNAKVAFAARSGPSYIQCQVSAGDMIAQDSGGLSMSPIYPTAFTQVVISQSTAPTLVTTSGGVGTASQVADAVWNSVSSSYNAAGTTGNKLNSAGSSGDPWSVDISAYPSGTAGNELHNKPSAAAIRAELQANLQLGLSGTQATMLLELYALMGLDPTKPLIVTDATRSAGTISQTIATSPSETIVTRV